MNKKAVIIIIVVFFVGLFGYKTFSVKIQEEKEKKIIQAQLLKEKTILDLQQEQKDQEKQTELAEQRLQENLLNSCLKKAVNDALDKGVFLGVYNKEVVEEVKKHFEEKDLVDLTLIISVMNAWNRVAISFRQGPAKRSS